MGKLKGACFRCFAHAASLYSVKNLQAVGECTGPAVPSAVGYCADGTIVYEYNYAKCHKG